MLTETPNGSNSLRRPSANAFNAAYWKREKNPSEVAHLSPTVARVPNERAQTRCARNNDNISLCSTLKELNKTSHHTFFFQWHEAAFHWIYYPQEIEFDLSFDNFWFQIFEITRKCLTCIRNENINCSIFRNSRINRSVDRVIIWCICWKVSDLLTRVLSFFLMIFRNYFLSWSVIILQFQLELVGVFLRS